MSSVLKIRLFFVEQKTNIIFAVLWISVWPLSLGMSWNEIRCEVWLPKGCQQKFKKCWSCSEQEVDQWLSQVSEHIVSADKLVFKTRKHKVEVSWSYCVVHSPAYPSFFFWKPVDRTT